MASYLKFELEDGTTVYIETTDVPRGTSGFPITSRSEHPSEQTAIPFEKTVQAVQKMASALMREIRSGDSQPPEEVQVNFGLKAAAEVGSLVIARGGMESNFNVMLRWSSKEKEKTEEKKEEKKKEG